LVIYYSKTSKQDHDLERTNSYASRVFTPVNISSSFKFPVKFFIV